MEKVFEKEPKYRLVQAKSYIFQKLIEDWAQATSLPLALREKLNEKCPLSIKAEMFISKRKDAIKARLEMKDGFRIESVLMRHKDGRNTVCVSAQVGCPFDCEFCATGKMGFKRNLEPGEILEQVIFFSRYLNKEKNRVTGVVFMGMGEPLLNYENVIRAIRILNDKEGLDIGSRHISISTAGIIEGIERLSEEKLQLNLAISLHSANDKLRTEIMSINKKYPIKEVLRAVDSYIKKTKRKVMFEYLLIRGLNDSDECAAEVAKLMKKPLYFLNLISYNPTGAFKPSTPERVKRFKTILEKFGVKFSQRYSFGQDIKAACGQFVFEQKSHPAPEVE